MLLLFLSSLVTRKVLQYSIGIATEQSFRYIELTDAKIRISKNASLCRVLENRVTILSKFPIILPQIFENIDLLPLNVFSYLHMYSTQML